MDTRVTHREGFFAAKDNLRLYWQVFAPPDPKALVALIHGYGDHSNRYLPLFEHLTAHGFAVHAFDYRGHGQADGRRGHVDRFGEYLDDLELFVQRVQSESNGRKIFVVGHSHGGLMMAKWALAHPQGIAGTVYSSPYLRLAIRPPVVKVFASKLVGRVIPWMPVKTELRIEQLSHDAETLRATERDPLYNRVVTPRWFTESTQAQEEVSRRASEIVLPTLMLVPEGDSIADPAAMRRFFESVTAQDKKLHSYPGAYHELFNEVVETRQQVLGDLVAWLEARR